MSYPRGAPAGPAMPPPQYQPVQQTYVIQGGFDAGARFDGVAQPNVPVSSEMILNYNSTS